MVIAHSNIQRNHIEIKAGMFMQLFSFKEVFHTNYLSIIKYHLKC